MRQSSEARLFASFWDDGTLDLLTGGAVVLIGLGYVFDAPLVEVVVLPLALTVWAIVRKRVVEPRTGYVEFTRERRARTGRGLLAALALGAGLLALTRGDGVAGTRLARRTCVDSWTPCRPS